jgi:hypothetical protein
MAETVELEYHGPVSLWAFVCADVCEGSDVSRICYAVDRYMLIRLRSPYYHYCEIDAATVRALQSAGSKRQYFEAHIRCS